MCRDGVLNPHPSGADAMGQTQFLPTNFLAYTVNADGVGQPDLWGSMAGVIASTANVLTRAGWLPRQPWGAEVRLPPGFEHGRADTSVRQASAGSAAEAVQPVEPKPPLPRRHAAPAHWIAPSLAQAGLGDTQHLGCHPPTGLS